MGKRVTATHCPYCALQCGMNLVAERGSISVASREFPTNKGGLCQKGWTATELLSSADRLRTPLMRNDRKSDLQPVSWSQAIEHIAAEIGRTQRLYGHDAVGVFGGGGLTNEKVYVLGKFARVALRTRNIEVISR